ncbi:MAG: hypothetical protein K0U47_07235 [Epsilonproteobacteria bacterium]|nr:hypothetical protein [Campylobacterota bacterium]
MKYILLSLSTLFFIACSSSDKQASTRSVDLTSKKIINNHTAYITSQCYTKTVDENGEKHNPCFSCHINSQKPNYLNDEALQEAYDFSNYSHKNRWINLFQDRSSAVANISDEEILAYVRESNYKDVDGNLTLRQKLKNLPKSWDPDKDGVWHGYTPDCYFSFDDEGFDRTPDGSYSRWRAFAYYPFLGTFWPTNGSTDDVLIRLDEQFFLDENSTFDIEVAKINHSIVETLIKQKDIVIASTDEKKFGVDLNQNGILDMSNSIVFNWSEPTYDFLTKQYSGYTMWYVGAAKKAQEQSRLQMGAGLYPVGTEFLHSVRYIDVDDNGSVKMAARMKELRYGKKYEWNSPRQHELFAEEEAYERLIRPDIPRIMEGNMEYGLKSGTGWRYQGFIEDKEGELRPQTYEETAYCMGCHSTIGAITDSTFVFSRKLDQRAKQGGWYHWSQYGLKNVKERQLVDGRYEYELYLRANHAGDEFRDNDEIKAKFFDANGSLIESEIEKVHSDISHLLFPSLKRALTLNKAYKVIVDEQSFIYGRDAHVKPVTNVHKEVKIGTKTEVDVIKY